MGEAFVDYIERYPADHTPDAGGVAAIVVVTIDLEDLRAEHGVATLDTGTPITAAQARRWACEAAIVPAVLGGSSEILDLGRTRRLHSRSQRFALGVRDRGCTADGCDRPPSMCQAHHDEPWSTGLGGTDVDHARLLCSRHHHLVHDRRYEVIHLEPDRPGGATRPHRRI